MANENNFVSKAACVNFCWSYLSAEARVDMNEMPEQTTTKEPIDSKDPDKCKLAKKEGNTCTYIKPASERWYFDQSIRACQKFVYNGCDGNTNNFESKAVCQDECEQISILDMSNLNSNFNLLKYFSRFIKIIKMIK